MIHCRLALIANSAMEVADIVYEAYKAYLSGNEAYFSRPAGTAAISFTRERQTQKLAAVLNDVLASEG